jgi:hypothetical protein
MKWRLSAESPRWTIGRRSTLRVAQPRERARRGPGAVHCWVSAEAHCEKLAPGGGSPSAASAALVCPHHVRVATSPVESREK